MKKLISVIFLLILSINVHAAWWSLDSAKGPSLVFISNPVQGEAMRIGGLSCQNEDCSMVGVHSASLGRLLNVVSRDRMIEKLENANYDFDFWQTKEMLSDYEDKSGHLSTLGAVLLPIVAGLEGVREVKNCLFQKSVVTKVLEEFSEVSNSCSLQDSKETVVFFSSNAANTILHNLINELAQQ